MCFINYRYIAVERVAVGPFSVFRLRRPSETAISTRQVVALSRQRFPQTVHRQQLSPLPNIFCKYHGIGGFQKRVPKMDGLQWKIPVKMI